MTGRDGRHREPLLSPSRRGAAPRAQAAARGEGRGRGPYLATTRGGRPGSPSGVGRPDMARAAAGPPLRRCRGSRSAAAAPPGPALCRTPPRPPPPALPHGRAPRWRWAGGRAPRGSGQRVSPPGAVRAAAGSKAAPRARAGRASGGHAGQRRPWGSSHLRSAARQRVSSPNASGGGGSGLLLFRGSDAAAAPSSGCQEKLLLLCSVCGVGTGM